MKRATWSRLIGRVLLLLFGSALIDRLIISRLPGLSFKEGQLVLVLLMAFVAWTYVLPLFAELLNSSAQDADAPPNQSTADTEVTQVARAAPQTKAIATVGITTLIAWIGASSIAQVELHMKAR
ncbi:hypothetical protein [Steroidobacter cummioxidans]|uniref:hypothetical protein n=1 Tax=Steroidobacter cummioxidans TaxID=1803913 RepID=UPI000E3231A5|nr:hypothetical protein [Steroidobacter cummioxidans]